MPHQTDQTSQFQGGFNPQGGFNFDFSRTGAAGMQPGGQQPFDPISLFTSLMSNPNQFAIAGQDDPGAIARSRAGFFVGQALPQMLLEQQRFSNMQSLLGNLLGGGAGGIGGIIPLVKQSMRPEFGRQREQLTSSITQQGGDIASGQSQAALGNLFQNQAAAMSQAIVQALLGQLGPQLGLIGQLGSAALR